MTKMKTVLITGVLGGMGRATAQTLLDEGFTVYGIDRAETCELPIEYFSADITDQNSIAKVYEEISRRTDSFDGIVHFAGIYNLNSLVEISEEEFVKIFNINLFGMYRVNKIFMPLLKNGGRIVITSSELAPLDPLPFTGLYAITKTAVEKYAYSLRMELNLKGIKVSVIRPGAVKTNMLGASTNALDKFCETTTTYSYNAKRFKKIVNSVENKNVSPQKIANAVKRALTKKRPKYIYNINRNILLRLLNVLPSKWQVAIIAKILK